MTITSSDSLLTAWAAAEQDGDASTIASLTTSDFTAVGPKGFVLDKSAWLRRYESKALRHKSFSVTDTDTRDYGDVAVVVGIQQQSGEYDGHDITGRFRGTFIIRRADGEWKLAGVHLSPVPEGA